MNKRVLTGILAIILFFSGFIRAGAVTSYHEGEVEEYVRGQLAAAHIPGVSLSIVTSQKEIYSVAFGDIKETSSDLQIGALTRTFTTLAIMQLVEKGDVKLDDSVYQYVDASAQDGISAGMSIQDLLSYTVQYTKPVLKFADAFALYDTGTDLEELSINSKFNLLGQVIEKVSGQSYASYIRENITAPLDMQSTYTVSEMDSTADITPGNKNYFGLPLKNGISNKEDYWLGIASNGLVSDVKDMGKYMQMYLSAGGKIISYNTIETITGGSEIAGKGIFGTDAYYSMGWIVTETDGKEVYYCNGSVDDYTSAMFIIPSMDIGITMLFNSADALAGQEFTDDIEAGVVSLVMGGQAKAVSSRDYLMEHVGADIIYFIAFVCALMPLLLMEVWVRWTKDKFSIIRLSLDVILHIILPTALIFIIHYCIAPWGIIKRVMPDLFYVAAVITGLFYFGVPVKLIAYFVIRNRKSKGYVEDEETDDEQEAAREIQERKDRLRKRMDGIKEAEQDKLSAAKVQEKPETLEKAAKNQAKDKEKKLSETNTVNNVKSDKSVSTEKKPERKDNIKNSNRKANNAKNRPEQTKKENKPKKFIVVNDSPAAKKGKETSTNKESNASKTGNSNKNSHTSKTGSSNKNSHASKGAGRRGNESASRNNQKSNKRNPANSKNSGKNSLKNNAKSNLNTNKKRLS